MMIGKKVIDSEPITVSEARALLNQKVEEKADENNEVDCQKCEFMINAVTKVFKYYNTMLERLNPLNHR